MLYSVMTGISVVREMLATSARISGWVAVGEVSGMLRRSFSDSMVYCGACATML